MYKLRELIAKTKADIISDGMTSSYKHKFGTNLFMNNITFRSARIESIILDKMLELDKQKKVEASLLIYDYLIMQHATLKCILEDKYDLLMNTIIYDKFITKFLQRRYSQFALVALVRSAMVLANQEFLLAFMVRRNNWRKKVNATIKGKTDQQKKKLEAMQKPTSQAIKEQVSKELDDQLPDHVSGLVVESALKTSSKRKRRAAAKKKNQSNKGTTQQIVVRNQETEFVEEVSSLTEMGEVQEAEIAQSNTYDRAPSRGRFNIGSNRGSFQARGRGGRPFVRQTGENDPYDMSIAPLFIYENQVLPIGIHNLSKSFRPNLATIRVHLLLHVAL